MAQLHTHYDNLKVARDAPPEVIRAAYKTLSQKYHPDRNPHRVDAIRIIQIINAAYEVLSDPAKRQEHDEWIARMEGGQRDNAGRPGSYETPQRHTRHGRHSAIMFGIHKWRRKATSGAVRWLNKGRVLIDRFSRRILSKS